MTLGRTNLIPKMVQPQFPRFSSLGKALVSGCALLDFRGTPLAWQSMHFTEWMLCLLDLSLNDVSIVSTEMPQLERRG